jgi:hypothetical protein
MKRFTVILCTAALVAAAASCNKLNQSENIQPVDEGQKAAVTLGVKVEGVDVITKAGDLAGQEYEKQVNKTSFFVFNSDGSKLEAYKAVSAASAEMSLKLNEAYKVYALVNYNGSSDLTAIQNEDALKALAMNLKDDSRTAATGFQMLSEANSKTFTDADLKCELTVSRIAARVRLVKVANNLPAAAGAITVDAVYLSNVVGNWAITAPALDWFNKMGRNSTTKASIGAEETVKVQTYQAVGKSVAVGAEDATVSNLYCYANSSTVIPAGWKDSGYAGEQTMMVIETTIGGVKYYYPVNISNRVTPKEIQRNYTYDVAVTINNYGSTDEPDKEIATSTMTVSVKVAEWQDGGDVTIAI